MVRERKKPEGSFIERAKNEIENEGTSLTKRVCELGSKRAYELGRIRGRKETIEKACDEYCNRCPAYADDLDGLQGCGKRGCDVLRDFRKALEG